MDYRKRPHKHSGYLFNLRVQAEVFNRWEILKERDVYSQRTVKSSTKNIKTVQK